MCNKQTLLNFILDVQCEWMIFTHTEMHGARSVNFLYRGRRRISFPLSWSHSPSIATVRWIQLEIDEIIETNYRTPAASFSPATCSARCRPANVQRFGPKLFELEHSKPIFNQVHDILTVYHQYSYLHNSSSTFKILKLHIPMSSNLCLTLSSRKET